MVVKIQSCKGNFKHPIFILVDIGAIKDRFIEHVRLDTFHMILLVFYLIFVIVKAVLSLIVLPNIYLKLNFNSGRVCTLSELLLQQGIATNK